MDSEANSYDYRTIEQRRYLVYYKKREDEKNEAEKRGTNSSIYPTLEMGWIYWMKSFRMG